MIVECIAIVMMLSVIVFIFERRGKRNLALTIGSLLLVPVVHLITAILKLNMALATSVDIIALAVTLVMIVVFCLKFYKNKFFRYSISCSLFSILLTVLLFLRIR